MASVNNLPVVVAGSREIVSRRRTWWPMMITRRAAGHRAPARARPPPDRARHRRRLAARLRTAAYTETLRAAGPTDRSSAAAARPRSTDIDGRTAPRTTPDTTAIFAANDVMALGAAAAAQERGRRIPQDLSLIGYDNSPLAHAQLLRLTTIDGQNHRVGDRGCAGTAQPDRGSGPAHPYDAGRPHLGAARFDGSGRRPPVTSLQQGPASSENGRQAKEHHMRFGIDVAQQRIVLDDLLARTRFGEACGFTGAWGFDHFQPMYGAGPGNCFEGMVTLAALAGVASTGSGSGCWSPA